MLGKGSKKRQIILILWISVIAPPPLSTLAKVVNIQTKEFFNPLGFYPLLAILILKKNVFINYFNFFLIMDRYMLNMTKYVLKKHQKVPKLNKIPLSTLSDPSPPPLWLRVLNCLSGNVVLLWICGVNRTRKEIPVSAMVKVFYVCLSVCPNR